MSSASYYNLPAQAWQILWENAPLLENAYWYYQDQETKIQFEALKAAGGPEAFQKNFFNNIGNSEVMDKATSEVDKHFPNGPQSFLGIIGAAIAGAGTIGQHTIPAQKEAYDNFKKNLQNTCLRWIKSGSLIAIGHSKARRPQDNACKVPSDLVSHGSFVWDDNKIYKKSLEMIDIRIVHPEKIEELMHAIDEQTSMTNGMAEDKKQVIKKPDLPNPALGRPTKEGLILRAFKLGVENEAIDFTQSNKLIYSTVESIICNEWPDEYEGGKGLGITPMRKYLKDEVKRNKL